MNWKLAGIFAAVWTPTDAAGDLLEPELERNLAFLRGHGVHGLLAIGTTGEFPLLTPEQRTRVLEKVIAESGGLPVVANISDIHPRVAAGLGRAAKSLGAVAVAVLPPPFFAYRQEDLLEFFCRTAGESGLPVVLYNFPERTGNRLELETIAAAAERMPLVGVKHSGADFNWLGPLVQLGREKHFAVFTGEDKRLPEAMALGVDGCVSGLANALPDLVVAIYEAFRAGTPGRAAAAAERMTAMGRFIARLPFPLNVSAALEARGLATGEMKTVCSPSSLALRRELVGEIQACFREWKLI